MPSPETRISVGVASGMRVGNGEETDMAAIPSGVDVGEALTGTGDVGEEDGDSATVGNWGASPVGDTAAVAADPETAWAT